MNVYRLAPQGRAAEFDNLRRRRRAFSSPLDHEKVRVGQSQTGVEVSKLDLLTGRRPVAVVVESACGVVVNNEVVEIGRACTDVEEIGRQRAGCRQFGEDRILRSGPTSSAALSRHARALSCTERA